jgi:hypothetical protein
MRPLSRTGLAFGFGVVAFAMVSRPLRAQRAGIVGVLLDTSTTVSPGKIGSAEVRITLTDSAGVPIPGAAPIPAVRADSAGRFAVHGLRAGVYRLDVRALGYEPFTGYLVLADEDRHPRVPLARMVPRLERVTTTASATYRARLLETTGFRARERVGFGHFIDSRQIARVQPASVLSLLRPYLLGCMIMYVNGARAAIPPGLSVDELVGVEIYTRNGQTPLEFQNGTSTCGSIVLWTAIPAPDTGDPTLP